MSIRLRSILLTSAVVFAAALCIVLLTEALWRVHALGAIVENVNSTAPATAEEVSRKLAPLLANATNADPIYRVVQAQHVELSQTHGLLLEFARAEYRLNLAAAIALLVLLIILVGISLLLPKLTLKPTQ